MGEFSDAVAAEPVRFVGAVQATLAAAVVTAHWIANVDVPIEVIAAVELAFAGWLSFVTRQSVTPVS